MKLEFSPLSLDISAFTRANAQLFGDDALSNYPRVVDDLQGVELDLNQLAVHWSAHGEYREAEGQNREHWLNLQVQATLPHICQRCLSPVHCPVIFDRWFQFVANENVAAELDEELEDDVLVLSRQFNLRELIEDELLLSMPLVPTHETCPVPVKLHVADADFEAANEKPKPFAALAALKPKP